MVTSALIQQLKQSNISKDGEKTCARVQEVWKTATAAQKQQVCDLADSARATVYRIFKTGGISIKLALALGQVLRIDPLYLTGQADSVGAWSDSEAEKLLISLGYAKQVSEQEKAVRRAQREAAKESVKPLDAAAPAEEAEAEEPLPAAEALTKEIVTNEDVIVLLQSLEIRAKAGLPAAKELLRQIKLLLLGV